VSIPFSKKRDLREAGDAGRAIAIPWNSWYMEKQHTQTAFKSTPSLQGWGRRNPLRFLRKADDRFWQRVDAREKRAMA
jgi:hypothetical protein